MKTKYMGIYIGTEEDLKRSLPDCINIAGYSNTHTDDAKVFWIKLKDTSGKYLPKCDETNPIGIISKWPKEIAP